MEKKLKRIATLQRLQKTGLALFYKKGYYNTSIDDVLKELSLSKGAFYYHFSSKEDFLTSIINDLLVKKIYSQLISPIENYKNPLQTIPDAIENALIMTEKDGEDYGFVVSNFLAEFKDSNENIINPLTNIIEEWKVSIINALQHGKTNSFVSRHVDSEAMATYIISSYIGVRSLMVHGNKRILKYQYLNQIRHYFNLIRG